MTLQLIPPEFPNIYEENFVFFFISAPWWLEESCLQCAFSYRAPTESSAWSSPAGAASGSSVQWWSLPRTTYGWDIVLYISTAKICNVPKIRKRNSQKGNCAASVPISIFIYLWAIYMFPRSFCLFGCSKIDGPILEILYKWLTDVWIWKLGTRPRSFIFGNT